MNELPFLILFSLNCIIYLALVALVCLILCKIKIKLNLATQLSFLMILLALLMERLLGVYWYVMKNRDQLSIFINCYIWVYESIVIAFYILNLGRMLASWILQNEQSFEPGGRLVLQINSYNKQLTLSLVVFLAIGTVVLICDCLVWSLAEKNSSPGKDWYFLLLIVV